MSSQPSRTQAVSNNSSGYVSAVRKVFFTFGGGGEQYRHAANRLGAEVRQSGVFDQVTSYTDLDLFGKDQFREFADEHGEFLRSFPRGYGYWLWKSYLFIKEFESLDEGDVVLYADAGCEVNPDTRFLRELVEYAIANELAIGDVRSPVTKPDSIEHLFANGELRVDAGHDHYTYSKMDLLLRFPQLSEFFGQQMCGATVVGMRKSRENLALLNAWYDLAVADRHHFLDDSPSVAPNHKTFVEHRHDQSIFSLLVYAAGLHGKFTSLVYLAFTHIRNRSGKNSALFNEILTQSLRQQLPANYVKEARTSSISRFTKAAQDPYIFMFAGIRRFFFTPTSPPYTFHTEHELRPYWECHFVKPLFLDRLVIFNRPGFEDRALPMAVTGYDANSRPVSIMRVDFPFGGAHDKSPLIVELGSRLGRFTGLRLQVEAEEPRYFHLAQILICLTSWGN